MLTQLFDLGKKYQCSIWMPFKEVRYNACVHYKWSEMNTPGIYIYSDRMEIESYGGITRELTKKVFLRGTSRPINKTLLIYAKHVGL